MKEHYRTQKHQEAILKVVSQTGLQSRDAQMDTDFSRTTTATVGDPAIGPLQEIYETLNILSGGIETLNDDGQRLSHESLQSQIKLQTLTEDFSQVKLSVEESHIFLEGVKHNQDILHQELSSLKEKINDMQHVSYDGSFVWKITNFREKMSESSGYLP
jgi:chromosome segregation ATPase